MFQTEFEFTLPCGFLDEDGTLHRDGLMRRATAADEIQPLRDPRVMKNPAYLAVILLARVITRLGSLAAVNPKIVEGLYATDLAFLQDLYNRVNQLEAGDPIVCPECRHQFRPEAATAGGVLGYPLDLLNEEVAFAAYHLHWPEADLMRMEHADRRQWVARVSDLNRRANGE